MAITQITQNNVTFKKVNKIGQGSPVSSLKKGEVNGMSSDAATLTSEEFAEDYGAVQSLNINWNGADFAGMTSPSSSPSTIYTTSDLLQTIKYAANGERFGKLMFAESLRE